MLLSYLKRHYKIILMLAVFAAVFAAVFSLYDLPVEAVWYAVALCFALGLILFTWGYALYVRRHRELAGLRQSIELSLLGLPQPKGALEADYQELLRILRDQAARAEAGADTERRNAAAYYTMWVHQIKTPIAALRLLLQARPGEDNAALEAELFRIEQYVDMALTYIRLDGEASDYLLRSYDLDDIVRQCVRKYAKLFLLQKLPLDFRESGLQVMTDEKWLSFIIGQLLSNALKYTPAGGAIRIYAEGTVLVIADSGIGIQPEDLPRVFEKGFTGYNGREDKKSTGLGLYLCRRVCDKLGHQISISSHPGQGTQVRLDLADCRLILE